MTPKRQRATDRILDIVLTVEPGGTNHARYKKMFDRMSDAQFHQFMLDLKDGRTQLIIYAPNMKIVLKNQDIFAAADKLGLKLFERLWMRDETTGRQYLTNHEYLVLRLPIRRTRQYLLHKLSVPESDRRLDALTGQVVKPDRASAMSQVEIQILYSRGLSKTIVELMKVRGGDVNAYLNAKRQMEETGSGSLNALEPNTVARSAVIAQVLFKGMLLDNNLVE